MPLLRASPLLGKGSRTSLTTVKGVETGSSLRLDQASEKKERSMDAAVEAGSFFLRMMWLVFASPNRLLRWSVICPSNTLLPTVAMIAVVSLP